MQKLRALLDALPPVTKAECQEDQLASPPYGTNLTYAPERYTRLHRTSGTTGTSMSWLDTQESWQWFLDAWKAIWMGVGLLPEDRIFFPFSFGPFIGFWGAFESALALGNFCLPGGGLSSAARIEHLLRHNATVLACTPTYALRLAEVARAEGIELASSAVRALVVAGEPGGHIEATRQRIEAAWGARVLDHHGMTEIGAVSYESPDLPGGLYIVENEFIFEVLQPGGSERVADGEVGELILTNLGRTGSPLIRYRTGDLVRRVDGPLPEPFAVPGREEPIVATGRLEGGILGRVDDMFFVRGNNVWPGAIEAVVRRFPDVEEFRIRVDESGDLTRLDVQIEPRPDVDAKALADSVASALQDQLLFRVDVESLAPGSLPRFELKARRLVRRRDEGPS